MIRIDTVRLVGFGEIGSKVMPTKEAMRLAQEAGLDLVEIGPDQSPPIVKIVDFGKYKYQQEKKNKESKKAQHVIQVKEIKLRPKIDTNDYNIKKNRGLEFLKKGDKVKVSLRFRGREMAHPEIGQELMQRFLEDTKEFGKVDKKPIMEGRQIVMVIAPLATVARSQKAQAGKSEGGKESSGAEQSEEKTSGENKSEKPTEE